MPFYRVVSILIELSLQTKLNSSNNLQSNNENKNPKSQVHKILKFY